MSGEASPALLIRLPEGTSRADRDTLVALLADHHLLAIQEDDVAEPRLWTAFFQSAAARDAAADALSAIAEAGLQLERLEIEDGDWARRTQADLPAVRIGRVVVAPPWDLPAGHGSRLPDGTIVVEIEPSRGFGTGHHQSTRLCLALLQARELGGRTVLDIGTGSGVLAIAAARLGAAFVSAIDEDPDAVENARDNISRNGVAALVEAHVRDLADGPIPAADVVTANLTGTLLARHAQHLIPLVRPAGSLIVSGFTTDEGPMVVEAFQPALDVSEWAEEEGWVALVLGRRT